MKNFIIICLCVGLILFIVFIVNWVLVKAIIWVVYELFSINWYDKFWVVFIAIFCLEAIFKSTIKTK